MKILVHPIMSIILTFGPLFAQAAAEVKTKASKKESAKYQKAAIPVLKDVKNVVSSESIKASATIGPGGSGGGDNCENRIQQIRDDIKDWIGKGGHQTLKLPSDISPDIYSARMNRAFLDAGNIKCVSPGDDDYPVQINGTPKTCLFKSLPNIQIICDREKFQKESESGQYVLVHHEFAGVAGLEQPENEISKYFLSNQITSYLRDTVVKKLAVIPKKSPIMENLGLFYMLQRKYLGSDLAKQIFEGVEEQSLSRDQKKVTRMLVNTYGDQVDIVRLSTYFETDEFDSIFVSGNSYTGRLPMGLQFGESRGSSIIKVPGNPNTVRRLGNIFMDEYTFYGTLLRLIYDNDLILSSVEIIFDPSYLDPTFYSRYPALFN